MNRFTSLRVATSALFIVAFTLQSFAQVCSDPDACNYTLGLENSIYGLDVDVVAVHEEGLLAGMTTYRLYFVSAHPDDFVSAVFGDSETPLTVETSTTFYQDALGGVTPNGIFTALYPSFPTLQFDSWVTIGIENIADATAGEADVQVVNSNGQNWQLAFDPGLGASGTDIIMDDSDGGAWFTLAGQSNGNVDADGRVLLGQFTTDGNLSGTLNLQVFPEGDQLNYITTSLSIGGVVEECIYPTTYYVDNDGDGYGTTEVLLCEPQDGYASEPGDCNDNTAVSFPGNPMELVGDGIDGDCDGAENCFRDFDGDGYRSDDIEDIIASLDNINCSEEGEAYIYDPVDCDDNNPDLNIAGPDGTCVVISSPDEGCGNPGACNYDAEALPEEDNCEFLSCRGCSNPAACNYDPDAQIQTELVCEFLSCAGCTDPTATNYNPEAFIADDSDCVYSGILAIGPSVINFNGAGPDMTYTNEVYALLPPEAIRLKRVLGVKDGDVRLRIEPFATLYNSESCGDWMPHNMMPTVDVDGVEYTNVDCLADSWFTIGGTVGAGPDLIPLGFDPTTLDGSANFDSDLLENAGDTLGWEIAGDTGGEPTNHCADLLDRPGCSNAVRIARLTMPLGESFFFQAGLTYTVAGAGERSITGQDFTDDSSISSESGGGGEADSDDAVITDGEANIVNGCLDATACNYDASANTDSGDCDYESCAGCTYPDADNYDDTKTVDDGSCTFSLSGDACPLDTNDDGLIGAADLVNFLAEFDTACPE